MEGKVETVCFLEEVLHSHICTVRQSFHEYSKSFEGLAGASHPPFRSVLNLEAFDDHGNSYISGIPGTQQDALFHLSDALATVIVQILTTATTITTKIDAITKPPSPSARKALADSFDEAKSHSDKFTAILTVEIPALIARNDKNSKVIIKVLSRPPVKSGSLDRFVLQIVEQRKGKEAARRALLQRDQEHFRGFCRPMEQGYQVFADRIRALRCSLAVVKEQYAMLAIQMRDFAKGVRQSAAAIDFTPDFSKFVANHKIIRYDLRINPFKPVHSSHPAFADVDTRIRNILPPIYPISLARITGVFVAESQQELSCIPGKHLLLMDRRASVWVLAMNPLTRVMGYVPSKVVEEVGNGLALFIDEPEATLVPPGVRISRGDYVSVVSVDGRNEETVSVITTKGETVSVPKDLLAIL
jgi:hypothetical protein